MVSKVTFPNEGSGYLYKRAEEPTKPEKTDYRYLTWHGHERAFDDERWSKDVELYRQDLEFYRAYKDKWLNPAANNLLGRTFEFKESKVNVLFGPNGSGKTTILRAIAGEAMIERDGFTDLLQPMEFFLSGAEEFKDKKKMNEIIETRRNAFKRNTSVVEWDGAPIYYHNFDEVEKKTCGYAGELASSILGSFKEEIVYHMEVERASGGQRSIYLFEKVAALAKEKKSLADIFSKYDDMIAAHAVNETFEAAFRHQMDKFRELPKYGIKSPITILLDEVDKSLDIEYVWALYTDALPTIVEKSGVQIILVSHSPLILSENIFNNKWYNIISVDDDYVRDVKKMLHDVKF